MCQSRGPSRMFVPSMPDGSVGRFPIVASNETTVTVDMNHPLAGQDLVFNISLVDIVKK